MRKNYVFIVIILILVDFFKIGLAFLKDITLVTIVFKDKTTSLVRLQTKEIHDEKKATKLTWYEETYL